MPAGLSATSPSAAGTLQELDDRALQHGVERTGPSKVPIRFVDARLERLVDPGNAAGIECRDRLRIAIVPVIAGRIDGERALRRT